MADHVRVDFEKLGEAQRRLETAGEQLHQVLKSTFDAAIAPFDHGGAWQGAARGAFAEEYRKSAAAVNALTKALRGADEKLGEIMRIMREAEEEARAGQ